MTDVQRVSMMTDTLKHGRNEFEQISDWMVDEGGDIFPDQLAMIFAINLLLEKIEESAQNRFHDREDSAGVARATQLLIDVLEDPIIRGD